MQTINNSNLNIAVNNRTTANLGATMQTIDNPTTDYVDLTDDQAVEQDIQKALPTLDEALAGVTARDSFMFTLKLTGGATKNVPVHFQHWDPRNVGKPVDFSGMLVGEPTAWSQPLKDYYDAVAGFGAVNMSEKWAEIDAGGLLLRQPWETYFQSPRGDDFGYVDMNYGGDRASSIPRFAPRTGGRSPESYVTAWGELIKSNRMPEIGFIAAHNGKYYASTDDWQKAQKVYRECTFTMSMVNEENGFNIWVGSKLQSYAKYFWSIWNLMCVNPELAEQISRQHYRSAITRKAVRRESQKFFAKARDAEKVGAPVTKMDACCGIQLVEGVMYDVRSPANVRIDEFRFSLNDLNAQSKVATYQRRYETNKMPTNWVVVPTNR